MGSKFEGFETSFKMTINAEQSSLLQYLRIMRDARERLDVKISKGIVSKLEMMKRFKSESEMLECLIQQLDNKVRAGNSCEVLNKVITNVTKRINNLWNNIFFLFTINDEFVQEFIHFAHTHRTTTLSKCNNCYVINKRIISKIEIISTQEDTIFDFASSDFIKILQTTAFVDKTLMIKELFQNKKFKRTVITAPRKYGKSTNLTMLKYFLEIQVDSLGKPLTKANAEKPITDTTNYQLFKVLRISKEAVMKEHFGKYPVLFANFKVEMHIKTFTGVIEVCKEVIHKAFQSHNYLQISSKLDIKEKKICKLWCDDESYKMISDINYIFNAFRSLCKCLTKHYNKPCFVLIDEPDFLTFISLTQPLLEDSISISFFISQCLLFLTNEEFVVGAFVTGKSGYAIRRILPSCIEIQSFSDFHEFTDYYGLTINELEYLFQKPEFNAVTVTINEVKAYYGSYNKIDQFSKTKKEIYCIWSILNVLKCKRLENFWRDFGTIFCNFSNPTIKDLMQKLLINEPELVIALVYDPTKPKTNPVTNPIIAASGSPNDKSLDFFFNFLLDIGYLTYSSPVVRVLDLHNTTTLIFVKIPNEDVKQDIKKKISLLS